MTGITGSTAGTTPVIAAMAGDTGFIADGLDFIAMEFR
jgi:hypothetical protein